MDSSKPHAVGPRLSKPKIVRRAARSLHHPWHVQSGLQCQSQVKVKSRRYFRLVTRSVWMQDASIMLPSPLLIEPLYTRTSIFRTPVQ